MSSRATATNFIDLQSLFLLFGVLLDAYYGVIAVLPLNDSICWLPRISETGWRGAGGVLQAIFACV